MANRSVILRRPNTDLRRICFFFGRGFPCQGACFDRRSFCRAPQQDTFLARGRIHKRPTALRKECWRPFIIRYVYRWTVSYPAGEFPDCSLPLQSGGDVFMAIISFDEGKKCPGKGINLLLLNNTKTVARNWDIR